MLRVLTLLLLFVGNIILIRKLAPYRETFAGGIELTLAGVFLAGYWFGTKTGILLGIVFMASSYLANFDITPSMIITLPASALLGAFGAMMANTSASIVAAAMIGVVGYCVICDLLMVKILGEEDYFNMIATDAGIIAVNLVMFRLFF